MRKNENLCRKCSVHGKMPNNYGFNYNDMIIRHIPYNLQFNGFLLAPSFNVVLVQISSFQKNKKGRKR